MNVSENTCHQVEDQIVSTRSRVASRIPDQVCEQISEHTLAVAESTVLDDALAHVVLPIGDELNARGLP